MAERSAGETGHSYLVGLCGPRYRIYVAYITMFAGKTSAGGFDYLLVVSLSTAVSSEAIPWTQHRKSSVQCYALAGLLSLRNCDGVMRVARLNKVLNTDFELNPHSYIICEIYFWLRLSRSRSMHMCKR